MYIDYGQIRRARKQYVGFNAMFALATAGTMATYAQFLLSKGFGYFESNLINSTFFITCFCLEIPTGVFADAKGRRNAFIASNLCFSISLIAYFFAKSMTECIMVEVLAAFARTLATGAFDSWLSSRLVELGLQGTELQVERDKAISQDHIIRPLLSIVGTILGAWLSSFTPGLPYLTSGCLILINGFLIALLVPESLTYKQSETKISTQQSANVFQTTWGSILYAIGSKPIRFSFLVWTSLTLCVQSLNMQWQPYFKPLVGSETGLGLLGGGMFLSLAIGGIMRKQFQAKAKTLIISLVGIGLCICITAYMANPLGILGWFLLHEIGRGLILPLRTSYVHHYAREKDRTTIRSIESMSNHIGGAIGLVVSGIVVEHVGIQSTWMYSGILLLLLATILFFLRPKS